MLDVITVIFGVLVGLYCFFGRDKFLAPKSVALPRGDERHYIKVESLFVNRAEGCFFSILHNHLPDHLRLFSKVRLEDIIGVRADIKDQRLRWALRGRVKSRHVDFVICAPNGKPLCVIELDGSSHNQSLARHSDDLKDRLFRSCGLPLYRVLVGEDFKVAAQEITGQFNTAQSKN